MRFSYKGLSIFGRLGRKSTRDDPAFHRVSKLSSFRTSHFLSRFTRCLLRSNMETIYLPSFLLYFTNHFTTERQIREYEYRMLSLIFTVRQMPHSRFFFLQFMPFLRSALLLTKHCGRQRMPADLNTPFHGRLSIRTTGKNFKLIDDPIFKKKYTLI